MTESGHVHNVDTDRLILGPDGAVTVKAVTSNFYEELDAEFDGFKGHTLVQTFEFSEPWGMWEMHPHGDEIVYLISGDVDFALFEDGTERVVRVDQPGLAVVVPRGVWHTARPRTATRMLFITPGEGTRNESEPE